jgi:hypothetical protein
MPAIFDRVVPENSLASACVKLAPNKTETTEGWEDFVQGR